jgi:hypothetical protein
MQNLLLKGLLEDAELPELEKSLTERARDDKMILPLMNVIRELMTYLPSDRLQHPKHLRF